MLTVRAKYARTELSTTLTPRVAKFVGCLAPGWASCTLGSFRLPFGKLFKNLKFFYLPDVIVINNHLATLGDSKANGWVTGVFD